MKKDNNYLNNQSGAVLMLLVLIVLVLGVVVYLYLGKANGLNLISQIKGVFSDQLEKNKIVSVAPKEKTTVSPTSQAQVLMTKSGFVPASLTIAKGQAVIWVNKDTVPHSISSFPKTAINSLQGLDSGDLGPGDSFTFTFEKVGTFSYAEGSTFAKFKGQITVK